MGFVLLIGSVIWFIVHGATSDVKTDAKPIFAGIAAILGLIAQFVAATFLAFHRSLNAQATKFARMLVNIARSQKAISAAQAIPNAALSDQTVAAVVVAMVCGESKADVPVAPAKSSEPKPETLPRSQDDP